MQQVISASRRTDIPAFYSEWFLNRLAAGHVDVLHPFTRQWFPVSLKQEDVGAIVFWSKNYAPLLPKLEQVERTTRNLFFHFTITGNKDLELRVPDIKNTTEDFLYLEKRYSPDHLIWRFDPICITDKLSLDLHEERFIACAERLKGYAKSCYISFSHPYRKVIVNFQKYSIHTPVAVPEEQQRSFAQRLARLAGKYGIRLFACCNGHLLSNDVLMGRCIDGRNLSLLFGTALETRAAASRKQCGCTRSMDIGSYNTCAHGCLYCYANTDQEKASHAPEMISPDSPALMPKHLMP